VLEALEKLLDREGVGCRIDDNYIQLFVPPEQSELAEELRVAAEADGYSTHQVATDHRTVTLTLTKDPRILA